MYLSIQSADHGDGLTALLFLLLKESDLVAGIVSELEIVGEHTACKQDIFLCFNDDDFHNMSTRGWSNYSW